MTIDNANANADVRGMADLNVRTLPPCVLDVVTDMIGSTRHPNRYDRFAGSLRRATHSMCMTCSQLDRNNINYISLYAHGAI